MVLAACEVSELAMKEFFGWFPRMQVQKKRERETRISSDGPKIPNEWMWLGRKTRAWSSCDEGKSRLDRLEAVSHSAATSEKCLLPGLNMASNTFKLKLTGNCEPRELL